LIQSISHPLGKKKNTTQRCKKLIEKTLNVLLEYSKLAVIIKAAGCLWKESDLALIMKTAIILHNMTIEDEEGLE
jgi:hypothetical protein